MEKISQIFIENLKNIGVKKDDKIVLGVSGGCDSVCLLNLFLASGFQNLIPVHINYHFRGNESDLEQIFCEKLFTEKKLVGQVFHFSAKKSLSQTSNLENTARQFRFAKFAEMQEKHQAKFVAVAHHKNDQAETVMMKMLRGSSLHGLSAMRFLESLQITVDDSTVINIIQLIRPLLNISRVEIENYAQTEQLKYCQDSSNADITFTRNFIRHQIFPWLKKVNSNFLSNLVNLAQETEEINAFLHQEIAIYLEKYKQTGFLLLEDWQQIKWNFLKKELLYCFYQELYGHRLDFYKKHLEQLLKIIEKNKSGLKKEFGNKYWMRIVRKDGKRAISFDKKQIIT